MTPRAAHHQAVSSLQDLDLAIDRAAEVPIGVQLAWAIRTRIGHGSFQPDERLPGLRDLANVVGVNINTVRAVYQRLEQEGLIESRQGSGTYVAPAAHKPSGAGAIAADAARAACASDVDPREVAAALYVSPERPHAPPDEEAGRRRLLRTQIAALERTVSEIEAEHPGISPGTAQTADIAGPTLLDSERLERVRGMLIHRMAEIQAAIDQGRKGADGLSTAAADPERLKRPAKPARRAAKGGVQRPAPAGS